MTARRALLASLLLVSLLVVPAARAAVDEPGGPLHVVGEPVRVSDREIDVTFTTDALAAPTTARVVLPVGYDASGATRYPMLLLLHGGAGRYTDWANEGLLQLTKDLPLITVLPDAGRSAWYTDWYNNGRGGTPKWETYHIDQLLPWVDANFPTVGARSGRAIAGLSSGGFGALSYASRHPDLFVAAAGFSAAADTNTPPVVAGKVIDALAAQDGGGPGSLFGLREIEEVRWRGHNPWDLATNLEGMDLTVRAGNGMAGGEYGGGGFADPGGYFLEKATYDQSVSFHNRLDTLGIAHVWDDYGPGTHNYNYWRRDLALTLPTFMQAFAEARPDPSSFSFRAIEPTFDIYDWTVAMDRSAVEFASLDVTSHKRFAVSGSGSASVTTPPRFRPGRSYAVTVGAVPQVVRAGDDGRLRLSVPLGPGNPLQQQFLPTHESPLTTVFTTEVTISPSLHAAG
jgi:S-formylglutathione hydrolase FrmB